MIARFQKGKLGLPAKLREVARILPHKVESSL